MNLAAVQKGKQSQLGLRRVLSAGSGPMNAAEQTWTDEWVRQGYQVVRLDLDPRNEPDICASMTDMGDIGSFDIVYCCHALEHLYPHEVPRALAEFYRVLAAGGYAVIMVPDLEDVEATDEPLEHPEVAPYTGLHLIYGDAAQIEQYPAMAHHCGFVAQTLGKALLAAGFSEVIVRRAKAYNLMATGRK